MANERYWRNPDTGEQLSWEQARTAPRKAKTRLWNMKHPILYGPHELSPLLKVLDDRVVSVSCLESGRPSKRFREVPYPGMDVEFPVPDLQVALMQTARGTILRFAAGFQVPLSETHWYHVLGTKGEVETRRGAGETGHSYTYGEPVLVDGPYRCPRRSEEWFHSYGQPPAEVAAQLDSSLVTAELRATGHGGMDGFPMGDFVRCLREGTPPDIDVYQAVDTAAPCIVAGHSAEQGGARLEVPDFRPGPQRPKGQYPA
jgi:predicted dehydrogenase